MGLREIPAADGGEGGGFLSSPFDNHILVLGLAVRWVSVAGVPSPGVRGGRKAWRHGHDAFRMGREGGGSDATGCTIVWG